MTVAVSGGLLLQVLHAALLLAAAPLVAGLTRWVRARLEGRRGPPPAQPYRDLYRGLRRLPALAPGASPVAAAAPLVAVAALALAAGLLPPALLPGLGGPTLLGPAPGSLLPVGSVASAPAPVSGDLVLIAALLGLSRFALALALSDAGTAAGGLAASQLAARPVLSDPALLLVAVCAAALAGAAAASDATPDGAAAAALGARAPLLLLALLAVLLVAASDTPGPPVAAADGSVPHDLGSVPEATGLGFSGWHLALWDYARALRRTLFLALLLALLPVPPAAAGAAVLGPLFGLAGFGLACVAVAALESCLAAPRPDRAPAWGVGALVLAAVAAALLLLGGVAA